MIPWPAALCCLVSFAVPAPQGAKPKPVAPPPAAPAPQPKPAEGDSELKKTIEGNRDLIQNDIEMLDEDLGRKTGLVGAMGTVLVIRTTGERQAVEDAVLKAETSFGELVKEWGFATPESLWTETYGPAELYFFSSANDVAAAVKKVSTGKFQGERYMPFPKNMNPDAPLWWWSPKMGKAGIWHRDVEIHEGTHFLAQFAGCGMMRTMASLDPKQGGVVLPRDKRIKESDLRAQERDDWMLEALGTYAEMRYLKASKAHCSSMPRLTGVEPDRKEEDMMRPDLVLGKIIKGERTAQLFSVIAKAEYGELDSADLAKGWSLVDWLNREPTRAKFVRLLRLRHDLSWESALKEAFGWTFGDLEREWQQSVGFRPSRPEPPKPPKPAPKK